MLFKMAVKDARRGGYNVFLFITILLSECAFYLYHFAISQDMLPGVSPSRFPVAGTFTRFNYAVLLTGAVLITALLIHIIHNIAKCKRGAFDAHFENGLSEREISNMLLTEILFIGTLAIIAGLILGALAALALEGVSPLFRTDNADFWEASGSSIIVTFIVFEVILLATLMFQLLAGRRHMRPREEALPEEPRKQRSVLAAILFAAAVLIIIAAYFLIIRIGLFIIDAQLIGVVLLGAAGTVLFFYALSALFNCLVRPSEEYALKQVVVGGLASRLRKRVITTSLACIFLAVSMIGLAAGVSLAEALPSALAHAAPYDVSFIYLKKSASNKQDIQQAFEGQNEWLNQYTSGYHEIRYYAVDGFAYSYFLQNPDMSWAMAILSSRFNNFIPVIRLADYNNALMMQGQRPIYLESGQYAINCNSSGEMLAMYDYYLARGGTIDLNGTTFAPKYTGAFDYSLKTSSAANDFGTIIVSDDTINAALPQTFIERSVCLNINYNADYSIDNTVVRDMLRGALKDQTPKLRSAFYTRDTVYRVNSHGLVIIISCAIVFISFLLLLCCAAALCMAQLPRISEYFWEYRKMDQYGQERPAYGSAIVQVALHFLGPALLAAAHAVILIYAANKIIMAGGNISFVTDYILVGAVTAVSLIAYLAAALWGAKEQVSNNE